MDVKFDDERSVTQLVRSVVKKALNQHFAVPEVSRSDTFDQDFDLSFDSIRQSAAGPGGREERMPLHFPSRINKPVDGMEAASQLYGEDRKSTRLNSSHVAISYAVFCLKTKKH